jgi:hypothetical protein
MVVLNHPLLLMLPIEPTISLPNLWVESLRRDSPRHDVANVDYGALFPLPNHNSRPYSLAGNSAGLAP